MSKSRPAIVIIGIVIIILILCFFGLTKYESYRLAKQTQADIESLKSSTQENQSKVTNLGEELDQDIVDLQSKIDKSTPIETFYTINNTYPTNNYITQGGGGSTGNYINLQAATPGVPQTGNFNITGTGIAGTLQGTTITDGTATITGGDISGVGTLTTTNINAFTLQGAITGNSQNITGVGTFSAGASTVTSLDVSSGGITNAGAVSGVTTLITSGKVTTPNINKQLIIDGTTYSADGAGIQAALNALPAQGGEVYIPEGTYNIAPGVAPITIPQNNITLRGAGEGTILYLADGANANVIGASAKQGLAIKDLYINGNDAGNAGTCHGINFSDVDYSIIDNVYIYDMQNYGINLVSNASFNKINNNIFTSNTYAIYTGAGEEFDTITANTFYSNNYAIYLAADNTVINDNLIHTSTSGAIYLVSSAERNTVAGNTIRNSKYGVYVGGDDNAITGNSIYNSSLYGIQLSGAENNTVVSNTIKDSTQYGIYLSSSHHNTIESNSTYSNSRDGIYINASNNNTISGNSVDSNTRHGVKITDSSSNTITGNSIIDNDFGNTATYDGIFLEGESDYNVISSNRLQDNDRYEINISAATCNENYLTGNDTYGTDHVGEINDLGTDTKYTQDNLIQTEETTIRLNPDGANAGEVVIGSATDQDGLRVYGDAFYEGAVNTWTNFDYAESFPITGDAEAGDVMIIDPDRDWRIKRSTGEEGVVAGIISTSPGFLAGSGEGHQPLALEGVVPCKVDADYGAIYRGSLLALSNTPGYAKRAGENDGNIVGIALENLDSGQGLIKVMVKVQNRPMTVSQAIQGASNQDILSSESNVEVDQLTDSAQISPNQEQILGPQTGELGTQNLNTSKLARSLQGGESSDWFADQDLKVKSLEIAVDLKVLGATTLATLEVSDSAVFKGEVKILSLATFEGELVVKKAATFEGDVKVEGLLESDKLKLGKDSKGKATILAGSQNIRVSFSVPYQETPVINTTPLADPASTFWVSNITKQGFVINLSEPAKSDIIFNWIVVQ